MVVIGAWEKWHDRPHVSKEAEIKVEAIPVHMHQGQTQRKQLKDKN